MKRNLFLLLIIAFLFAGCSGAVSVPEEALQRYATLRNIEVEFMSARRVASRAALTLLYLENEFIEDEVGWQEDIFYNEIMLRMDIGFERLRYYIHADPDISPSHMDQYWYLTESLQELIRSYLDDYVVGVFSAIMDNNMDMVRQLMYNSVKATSEIYDYFSELFSVNSVALSDFAHSHAFQRYHGLRGIEVEIINMRRIMNHVILYTGDNRRIDEQESLEIAARANLRGYIDIFWQSVHSDYYLSSEDVMLLRFGIEGIEWELFHFIELYVMDIIYAARNDDLYEAIHIQRTGIALVADIDRIYSTLYELTIESLIRVAEHPIPVLSLPSIRLPQTPSARRNLAIQRLDIASYEVQYFLEETKDWIYYKAHFVTESQKLAGYLNDWNNDIDRLEARHSILNYE